MPSCRRRPRVAASGSRCQLDRRSLRRGWVHPEPKVQDAERPVSVSRSAWQFRARLIKNGQSRIDRLRNMIIRCLAGDCTAICRELDRVRDTQAQRLDRNSVVVLSDRIKQASDAVLEEDPEGQSRALHRLPAIVIRGALRSARGYGA